MKKDIRAYGYEELQKEMAAIGEKAFRAKQIMNGACEAGRSF